MYGSSQKIPMDWVWYFTTILFSYFCLVDQFTAKLKSDFSLHSKDILLLQRSIFSMFGINWSYFVNDI